MVYCMADLHGEREFFLQMLEQIHFSESDHLYILGDVIDRGPDGVELLLQIMASPNMTMLLGNHEQMCLSTLGPRNKLGARELWRQNGGAPTYRELLYHRTPPERNRILQYLSGLPDHLECTVGGQKFYLVHGCPGNDHDTRIWGRVEPDSVSPYDRFSRMGAYDDRGSTEDQKMLEELRHLPAQLPLYQKQIQRFFDLVLDVDRAGRDPQQQAARNYCYDTPNDPELFYFRPIPLSFESVEPGRCSQVLYSACIPDMIDYALRSCVERGITVRRCKNCGRYFPQTGRVSAEYCERPVAEGQQTCRDAGAFQQWTKKQSDDPVFKAYRKEYKRRFAWIKAGRISDTDFYAWSEQARERKKQCDSGALPLTEFEAWLKHS